MSAWFDSNLWWPMPGLLVVEVALLVGIAAVLQRFIQSAMWRRTLWQACLVGIVLLAVVELTGAARGIATRDLEKRPSQILANSAPKDTSIVAGSDSRLFASVNTSTVLPLVTDASTVQASVGSAAVEAKTTSAFPSDEAKGNIKTVPPEAWLMAVWLIGLICVLGRAVVNQLLFAWIRRDERPVTDLELTGRVASLGRRLAMRRGVRLVESPRFAGPIAFGLLRPMVGLPRRFAAEHSTAQQEVMLAHELGHLAAGDPFWYRLADFATALLWWHPAVWWARGRLHATSEVAADEASLLVANGPGVLAECLVELGSRLVRPQAAGRLGIEGSGFRSGLGRRVQRLVNLRSDVWSPPHRFTSGLVRTLCPAVLVLAAAFCSAWTFPETSNKGATMKPWQQALSVLTLAATFGTEPIAAAADTPVKSGPKPEEKPLEVSTQPFSRPPVAVEVSSQSVEPAPPTIKVSDFGTPLRPGNRAQLLHRKLEQIVLAEVTYDALPLGEVIEELIRQSAKLDPEKQGVNFLFGQERVPAAPSAIDPATGLPVVAPPREDFDLRSVTIVIRPALKNLRLIDVLDAIVKVADQPIKYSIDEYAVVFNRSSAQTVADPASSDQMLASPMAPVQTPLLQTRAFKVNTNTFFAIIERMFDHKISPSSKDVGTRLRRSIFPEVGAQLTAPGSQVFYNEFTGMLLVRATVEEMVAVQSLIETLGGAPVTGAAVKPSGGKSSFLNHLAEGPHTHLHRAVTGVFDALGNLAPPPFNRSNR